MTLQGISVNRTSARNKARKQGLREADDAPESTQVRLVARRHPDLEVRRFLGCIDEL
jgi:hypothetical protein